MANNSSDKNLNDKTKASGTSTFGNWKFLLGLFVFLFTSYMVKDYLNGERANKVKNCFENETTMQECYKNSADFRDQCLKNESCAQTFSIGAQLGKDIMEKVQIICNYDAECAKNRFSLLLQRAAKSGSALSELKTIESELDVEILNR